MSMAEPSTKRRSTRQAHKRKRSPYTDPETEDDFGVSSDSDEEVEETPPPAKKARTSKSAQSKPRPQRTTRSRSAKTAAVSSTRRKPHNKSSKPRSIIQAPVKAKPAVESDGKIPPWSTLPYAILLQIFTYTAQPESRTWLLQTARKVCRAFAEPALSAYYQCPPLPSPGHLQYLHQLLDSPEAEKWMNYNVKVKRLDLNVYTLASVVSAKEPFELALLASVLPQLSELYVTFPFDKPPYRRLANVAPRWRYPENLFEALEVHGQRLKSWRWNWLFINTDNRRSHHDLCAYIGRVHTTGPFQSLEHLEVASFPSKLQVVIDQEQQDDEFADQIGLLPNLKSLTLESSDMIRESLLKRLPQTLHCLKISNCRNLDSEALQGYLAQDGSCQLRSLTLDHNQRLDLAFLPTLKMTCPHLQVLKMDLHYYSARHSTNDAVIDYEYLLGADEVPTWPSSLQTLELVHLQKWSAEGASNLFRSLIEQAVHLPDLRTLTLHAHIAIAWRDRAVFRDQWIERLQRVFLRNADEPNPTLASYKAYRKWKERQARLAISGSPENEQPTASRSLDHVLLSPRGEGDMDVVQSAELQTSDSEPLSKRRARRAAKQPARLELEASAPRYLGLRRTGTQSDAVAIAPDEGFTNGPEWRVTPEKYLQGLCNIVDIRIDNQRPREEQFNESHFLDEEASGDEEWIEGDELPEERHAW